MQSSGKIFWASFLTLIAAGMGFAIRGKVLGEWSSAFGFTKTDLGTITGGGLVGMAFTIIGFSLFADRVGYKLILIGAFLLHVSSAVVTLAATPVFDAWGQTATYWCLYVGMFMFSLGNGMCEAAINPLVATLYPKQKTHYLNILHAGWPGGLILGGLLAFGFVGETARVSFLRWEIPMMFFLVPTLWYGAIVIKEKFPISEARAAGVKFGEMLAEFAAPVLLFLLLLHALVGYVELGTDSWITNITQSKLATIGIDSVLLLVYTAGLMFVLRFFAGPIVERINPLGLLFVSSVLACIGLYMMGEVLAGSAALVDAGCGHDLRRRQDVLLAHDVGRRRRALSQGRRFGDGRDGRRRDAVGRLARRPGHRLHARRLRVEETSRTLAGRLRQCESP